MNNPAKILVVDDTPANLKLLADLLSFNGYSVLTARDGEEGLEVVGRQHPDLVLADIMMPRMSGYELCQRIRGDSETAMLPVVLVTSLDPNQERLKGIEAGADDFIPKPIQTQELLARVRSLLRIKALNDKVREQAGQLAEWNARLQQRVDEQVRQLEGLSRLKRFLSPQLAEMIMAGDSDPMRSHRREVTVVFLDLRGFTSFAETAEPEEVMGVLREYHTAMGRLIQAYEGTLERFTGDGMMIFFNDPIVIDRPAERAVRMSVAMRGKAAELNEIWIRRGIELGLGIGIAKGYATIGAIGFEERVDYGAIGTVTNLSARLCSMAAAGEILVDRKTLGAVEELVTSEAVGPLELHGFCRPVPAFRIVSLTAEGR